MTNKIYTREEWLKTLEGLRDSYRILVPVKEENFYTFRPLEDNIDPDFHFRNTRLSPKSLVYPQSERMLEYSIDPEDPDTNILKEVPKDYQIQAIVGIRPCDVHAFEIVKINFDNPEFRDPWWVKRFESTILVGMGCNEPCSTCFCTSVGGGPFREEGLDVLLFDMDEKFLAKAITERGEAFLKKVTGGKKATKAAMKEAEKLKASANEKMTSPVPIDRLSEKVVNELFDAPFWDEVAFACLNCGVCTYLCPTCWCFDIQDELSRIQGDRMRNWDSCMFPLFTLHGSGHNPRDKKFQRVRQRFMHKLKYYVDKYNNGVQCSGCGRCVRNCPVNIDIRHVAELMNDV